jgi:hypothetical protein
MKKIILTVVTLAFSAAAVMAGGPAPAPKTAAAQFKKYSMDHGYFSCVVPAAWSLEREKERDEDYRIFEIQLLAPKADKAPTSIFVSYYAKENEDFDGPSDFIDRNSTNALGETKSLRENYEPVKKITLAGRKAFELAREKLSYLHPESKSDESVQLKEKLYVLPAKEGFYVLHFSAQKDLFDENLPVFEKIAKSFKGKF